MCLKSAKNCNFMSKYEIKINKIEEIKEGEKYPDTTEVYSQVYESVLDKPLEKIIKAVNEIE